MHLQINNVRMNERTSYERTYKRTNDRTGGQMDERRTND